MACVDTRVDPSHCGGCGTACSLPNTSVEFCAASTCRVGDCAAGFSDCDGLDPNGCEAPTTSDPLNCGGCGIRCGASEVCTAGVCRAPRRAFVTSVAYDGNLGGLTGADARCQARADAAGLGGTWMAWISTTAGSPSTRFTRSSAPYVRIDGATLATNWADLTDGTLATTLTVSETGGAGALANTFCGGATPGQQVVWSATQANGTFASSVCADFTSTSGGAMWGNRTNTDSYWSSWCSGGTCSWVAPIYCFEQ